MSKTLPKLTQSSQTQLPTYSTFNVPRKWILDNRAGWAKISREKQRTPDERKVGEWETWLILAGRGWGKTLTGAQDLVNHALMFPGSINAVVAPTSGDLRRVCFNGPSGINRVVPQEALWKGAGKAYNSGTSELRFSNGSLIQGFAAIEPQRLRGPQFHRAWCDELAAWRYPEAWDQLMFGLRLGKNPQSIVTTTPRPTQIIRDLVKDNGTHITKGDTFENEANLAGKALRKLKEKYEGTRLGRQELYAEVLEDVEGALWKRATLENCRVTEYPPMTRIVISVDPSATKSEDADEVGIIVAGLGTNKHAYIFEDLSATLSPDETCVKAINAYTLWEADRIVAEANNGGDWIETLLRTRKRNVSYKKLHASRGKQARAEPVAALYEQKRVHHVGVLAQAEDELCTWEPNLGMASPNRLDAIVWAVTELMLRDRGIQMLHVKA